MYWKACVLSDQGKVDEALAILARALENGIWWHPHLLAHDPDFKPLQESEAFKKIIKLCQEKLEKNKDGIRVQLFEYGSPEAKTAIFSLHWRDSNVEAFVPHCLDEWDENIPILAREKTALWAYGHIVFSRFFLRLKARL